MVQVAVFDAYGTLLDVHSPMRAEAARLGPDWQRISSEWRSKHIEYTWVRTLAGAPRRSFWDLAAEALEVVTARNKIADRALLDRLLQGFRRLDTYPEVPAALRALRAKGIKPVILSNGDPALLAEAATQAGIAGLLEANISAEAAGVYKPDPRVYRLVTDRFALPASDMAFFSSNPWDAFGAMCFGFQVFWVNRTGLTPEYGLDAGATILSDLSNIPL